MIDTGRLAAVLLTEFGLFIAPGPSVVFVVSRGVASGRRAALLAVAGNTLGLATQLVVVVVLLGGAFHSSAGISEALKLAGAAWLIYLGARGLQKRGSAAGAPATSAATGDPVGVRQQLLGQGWVVGLTNPKGIVTFTALAPTVISSGHARSTAALAAVGALGVLVALICDGAWGLASGTARTWVGATGQRRRLLDTGSGVLMIGFGIGLAIYTLA